MATKVVDERTKQFRLLEITHRLSDLKWELRRIAVEALPFIEELENITGVPASEGEVPPETRAMFRTVHVLAQIC